MSAAERIAAARQQLEALKTRIRQKQQQKEEEISWETTGKASTVRFAFGVRRRLRGHAAKIIALDWSGDPQTLLSASQDGKLIIWNASGSCDSTVKIWDIRANACVRTFTGHVSDVNSVEFFPNGNIVGTGSDDATCRMFDLRSCGPINVFTEQHIVSGVTDVSFSSTGRLMFASYDEDKCRAWETITKEGIFHELKGHTDRVSCLGVNSAGNALCTGSWDTELAVWT